MPSSSNPQLQLVMDQIEDFADPLGWQRIRNITEHPEYPEHSERIRTEAFEKGRLEEAERSQAELLKLKMDTLDRLNALLERMSSERRSFHQENSEELLRLSMAIARRVTHALLPGNSEAMGAKLQSCLKKLGTGSSFEIIVNPAEKKMIESLLIDSGGDDAGCLTYTIAGDPRLEPGDMVLEAREGIIEAICGDELDRLLEHIIDDYRTKADRDELSAE